MRVRFGKDFPQEKEIRIFPSDLIAQRLGFNLVGYVISTEDTAILDHSFAYSDINLLVVKWSWLISNSLRINILSCRSSSSNICLRYDFETIACVFPFFKL